MLRERLQGALGGVAQDARKVSAHSTGSGHNRQHQSATRTFSGGSGGYNTGIHNPAAETFQPQPVVPHLDQGGISQRRGSRPPADPYDPYGNTRRISSEATPNYYQPSPPTFMQPSPIGQGSNPQQPNIFTPDFSQSYSQVPPPNPNAGSAMAPPPPPTSGMS